MSLRPMIEAPERDMDRGDGELETLRVSVARLKKEKAEAEAKLAEARRKLLSQMDENRRLERDLARAQGADEADGTTEPSRLATSPKRRHLLPPGASNKPVHVIERLNQVEDFLSSRTAQAIERLNQVEAFLSSRAAETTGRLNEVEAFLSHRTAEAIERLNEVEAFLVHTIGEAGERTIASRPEEGAEAREQGSRGHEGGPPRAFLKARGLTRTMAGPARFLWRRALPLRRMVARLRRREP